MIIITPQGLASRIADYLMMPLMYFLQGTLREVPQRTHRWNNQKFKNNELSFLTSEKMFTVAGDSSAFRRWWGPLPIFHIPLLGGWSKFVVLETTQDEPWFIGWLTGDTLGVSKIPLRGPVRVLVGSGPAQFFALRLIDGVQLELKSGGHGRVGNAGEFGKIPLL